MAQYTVAAGCGHTTSIALFGAMTERERRLAWMRGPDGKCNSCYAAAKRAEEAQQSESLIATYETQLRRTLTERGMGADDAVLVLAPQIADAELHGRGGDARIRAARRIVAEYTGAIAAGSGESI